MKLDPRPGSGERVCVALYEREWEEGEEGEREVCWMHARRGFEQNVSLDYVEEKGEGEGR